MFDIVIRMFDPDGFVPRWECGDFGSGLGWMHVVSDLATFVAYYAVPIVVSFYVLKRKDIPYRGVLLSLVCIVFLSCGTVHLVEAGIFWWPLYRLSGVLKLFTAIASCGMVAVMIITVPKALGLRSLALLANDLQKENVERKHAEDELRNAHGQLKAILNSTADAIILLDADGIVRSFNRAAERHFGYQENEVLSKNIDTLVPDLGDAGNTGQGRLRMNEMCGLSVETELTGCRKHGGDICLAARVTEIEYAGESQFIATFRDITERKMAERERTKMFDAVRETASHLWTSSAEISATTAAQSQEAEKQAGIVSETASEIDEAAAKALESTQIAHEVANTARSADEVGQSGREAVEATQAIMQKVREQVESIAANILTLAGSAQAIGDITTTVNDIAEQTNVLALNAAVEASRAGESGKGFAVVAAEVKLLAGQAKDATARVRTILDEIQQAMSKAVRSTEQGTNLVTDTNHVVAKAAKTIDELGVMLGAAAQAATRIVGASTQQASIMTRIKNTIDDIERTAQAQLAANRQTELAAVDLNTLGNRLKSLVESNGDETAAE